MSMSPRDESGHAVDWWFVYKVPKLDVTHPGGGVPATTGYEYVYYDPKVGHVKLSSHQLLDGKSALDHTLDSVFKHPASTAGWILYNDEMPTSAHRNDSGVLGHTKGVLAFDTKSKTALWLIHSWPKYVDPAVSAKPTPMYGQTFLCLAIDLATANKIAAQMATDQEPQTYLPHLPASLAKTDPLYRLTQPIDTGGPGDATTIACTTRGGMPFKVIAKNRQWGLDFWNELVGPTLNADMNVETWIRGPVPSILDSDGIHKTFDVKFIDLRPLGTPWAWPETHDHAKWGLTLQKHWICVGDINRMISQRKRGGGTVAFQDAKLWAALDKTDLLVPPPGMNIAAATTLIQETHGPSMMFAARITAEREAGNFG